jgi:putative endonuclease
MAMHNKLGSEGEELAAAWLVEKGYRILFRNWRFSYYEIDIIAVKGKVLHIIEIKTRNASRFGFPEESVTKKKFRHLQKAADEFLFRHPGYRWIQYDILSITMGRGKKEYFLLEDVFL